MNKFGILILFFVAAFVLIYGQISYSNRTKVTVVESTKTESVPVEENLFQDRGKLVYSPMGDSLTSGFYALKEDEKFVQVLADTLENKLGYQVELKGVGGYGGILENGLKAVPEVNQQKPDLVTIEYGTNDCNEENNVPIETFEQQLNDVIDGLLEENTPKIILVTTWNQGASCKPFDDVIKSVALERGFPVADLEPLWNNPETKGPAGLETYLGESDNWHPNSFGMKEIANAIYEVSEDYIIE